jgi:hypothetical protein
MLYTEEGRANGQGVLEGGLSLCHVFSDLTLPMISIILDYGDGGDCAGVRCGGPRFAVAAAAQVAAAAARSSGVAVFSQASVPGVCVCVCCLGAD